MNVPNLVTGARIALVPLFLLLAYGTSESSAVAALVVFAIASLSDQLDGYLARRNDSITRLGQFLDPLADKLLVGAALVVLVGARAFPLWAAFVIVFREVAVQILRIQIVRGGANLPASRLAKAKTVLQLLMVSWWLLPWDSINAGHWILLTLTLAATLWSAGEYLWRAQGLRGAVD